MRKRLWPWASVVGGLAGLLLAAPAHAASLGQGGGNGYTGRRIVVPITPIMPPDGSNPVGGLPCDPGSVLGAVEGSCKNGAPVGPPGSNWPPQQGQWRFFCGSNGIRYAFESGVNGGGFSNGSGGGTGTLGRPIAVGRCSPSQVQTGGGGTPAPTTRTVPEPAGNWSAWSFAGCVPVQLPSGYAVDGAQVQPPDQGPLQVWDGPHDTVEPLPFGHRHGYSIPAEWDQLIHYPPGGIGFPVDSVIHGPGWAVAVQHRPMQDCTQVRNAQTGAWQTTGCTPAAPQVRAQEVYDPHDCPYAIGIPID